jgi:hypothetical protein
MRPILDDIISVEQSTFVPGKLITDNVLIAFECIHAIQRESGKDFVLISWICPRRMIGLIGDFYKVWGV